MNTKHTPGPWEVDTVRNEGEYGNGGPDSHVGFESFAIIDEQGRVLFDTLNRDGALTEVDEEADAEDGYHRAWDRLAEADANHLVRCVNVHGELLAALLGVIEMEEERIANSIFKPNAEGMKRIEAARAAIAKATGEKQ